MADLRGALPTPHRPFVQTNGVFQKFYEIFWVSASIWKVVAPSTTSTGSTPVIQHLYVVYIFDFNCVSIWTKPLKIIIALCKEVLVFIPIDGTKNQHAHQKAWGTLGLVHKNVYVTRTQCTNFSKLCLVWEFHYIKSLLKIGVVILIGVQCRQKCLLGCTWLILFSHAFHSQGPWIIQIHNTLEWWIRKFTTYISCSPRP